jgi:hypothetical protein
MVENAQQQCGRVSGREELLRAEVRAGATGSDLRFQIADFKLKTVTSDEREKQESSACGFCWEWSGWGLLIADVREANAAKDSAPSARTPGGDRRFQIPDFRLQVSD